MKSRIAATGAVMILTFAASAEKEFEWKRGTVLDSQSAKTFVQTGSTTQSNATATTSGSFSATTTGGSTTGSYDGTSTAHGTSQTQIHSMSIQDTQLLIVADDFLYAVNDSVQKASSLYGVVGQASANRKHSGHVIVNQPVWY